MPSVIKTVTFDAADALVLARFWAAVFGSDVDEESTADKAYLEAAGWGGPNIWFARVPEGKTAKNRMHFDLRAPGPAADEVARLEKLGARVLERSPAPCGDAGPRRQRVLRRAGPGGHTAVAAAACPWPPQVRPSGPYSIVRPEHYPRRLG